MDTKQNEPKQRCGESCDLCNHPMDVGIFAYSVSYRMAPEVRDATARAIERILSDPKLLTAA